VEDPSSGSLFNDHSLAHSMPGAGVVHHIIFDQVIELIPRADVRFDPERWVIGPAQLVDS
jgi:hypothetical protein